MKNICKKIIIIMIITTIVLSFNFSLGVTQSELEAQKNKEVNSKNNQQTNNQNKIKEAEEHKEQIQAEKSEVQKEVENLSAQINTYQTQIDELDAQIEDANNKIKEAETKIQQSEEEYNKKEETLEKRMVAVYEAGETSYLDVLLNSESLSDFISKYYIVSEVTEHDTELMKELQKEKEEIEKAKKELENSKNQLTTAKNSKESVSGQLKVVKSEKDAKVSQLSVEEKEVQAEIEELEEANRVLNAQIKAAEKKYQQQLEELKKQEENNNNNGGNSSTGSGYFMRPVNGGSISCNGYYSSGKFHGAIDYAVSSGTPVYAAAAGVVMSTANLSNSYGTYVVIRHANGLQSYYAHGTYGSICVSPGQTVSKGQKIMLSGNTGNSSGPHLHFEVRKSPYNYNGYATGYGQDSRVNPTNYM